MLFRAVPGCSGVRTVLKCPLNQGTIDKGAPRGVIAVAAVSLTGVGQRVGGSFNVSGHVAPGWLCLTLVLALFRY